MNRHRPVAALLFTLLVVVPLLTALATPALATPAGAGGPAPSGDEAEAPLAAQDDSANPCAPANRPRLERPEEGELVGGQLCFEGDPVEGVEIGVTQGGDEIGVAVTDSRGAWSVELPSAGEYDITVVTDTLPEGIGLRNPDRITLENISITAGQPRVVAFPLGERAGGRDFTSRFLDLGVQGIKTGLVIALASVGLSLIYGVTGLVNFAHGELVTFGALVAWFANASVSGPGLHLIPSVLVGIVAGAALGWSLDAGLWNPLRRIGHSNISMLVVSIGLSLLLRHVFLLFFGARPRPFRDYAAQAPLELGPVRVVPKDLWIIAIAVAVLVAVGLVIQLTRLGTSIRAVADNPDLASASGIDSARVIRSVWFYGAGLAALGGAMLGATVQVDWNMGFTLLLLMFAAVVLGGLGTAFGAMAGGLVVGFVTEVSTLWLPVELKTVAALSVLVAVLLFRPQGIFGVRERIG